MINQLKRPASRHITDNSCDNPVYNAKRLMLETPQNLNNNMDVSTFCTINPYDIYHTQPRNSSEWEDYREMCEDYRYLDRCEHPDLFKYTIRDYQRQIHDQTNYICEYMYFYSK